MPQPELSEQAGSFCVRFKSQAADVIFKQKKALTARQLEIIEILKTGDYGVREILRQLKQPPALPTLRDDLYFLKKVGIINFQGYGRSALWFLIRTI